MQRIEIPAGDITLAFQVEIEHDIACGAPWEEHDGHGPVSVWTTRKKKPGEWVMSQDHHHRRYYDFEEAMRIAKRDGWGVSEEEIKAFELKHGSKPTKAQVAEMAVRQDFEYLSGWSNDEWSWQFVKVTLLDPEGNPTNVNAVLGGVESLDNQPYETAMELAEDIVEVKGTAWDVVTVQTYRRLESA